MGPNDCRNVQYPMAFESQLDCEANIVSNRSQDLFYMSLISTNTVVTYFLRLGWALCPLGNPVWDVLVRG